MGHVCCENCGVAGRHLIEVVFCHQGTSIAETRKLRVDLGKIAMPLFLGHPTVIRVVCDVEDTVYDERALRRDLEKLYRQGVAEVVIDV